MDGWQTQVGTSHRRDIKHAPPNGRPTDVAPKWQLTVILPAYNEQGAIGRVLGEIVEALSDEPIHLHANRRRRYAQRVNQLADGHFAVALDLADDMPAGRSLRNCLDSIHHMTHYNTF